MVSSKCVTYRPTCSERSESPKPLKEPDGMTTVDLTDAMFGKSTFSKC